MKRALIAIALVALTSCAGRRHASPQAAPGSSSSSASPSAAAQPMSAHGMAGWVGQEFSGRTTANGEVFDPMLMTAAHRTLPFGTLLDVRNPKTGQTVRVRVNDRGPYVGDRLIDLSYAAAQQIGLDESGGGEIDMTVVKVGRGDREPPVPFAVNVPQSTNVTAIPPAPTPAPAPAPVQPRPAPAPAPAPATVDSVQVTEQHAATVETRRQVAASGTSMVDVPVTSTPLPAPAPAPSTAHATPAHTATAPSSKTTQPAKPTPQPKTQPATTQPATSSSTTTQTHTATSGTGHYVVQVGAFAQEGNARALQQKLKSIGQESTIDHTSLYFVRIGPFETREQAAGVRSKLEAKGISAIITKV